MPGLSLVNLGVFIIYKFFFIKVAYFFFRFFFIPVDNPQDCLLWSRDPLGFLVEGTAPIGFCFESLFPLLKHLSGALIDSTFPKNPPLIPSFFSLFSPTLCFIYFCHFKYSFPS